MTIAAGDALALSALLDVRLVGVTATAGSVAMHAGDDVVAVGTDIRAIDDLDVTADAVVDDELNAAGFAGSNGVALAATLLLGGLIAIRSGRDVRMLGSRLDATSTATSRSTRRPAQLWTGEDGASVDLEAVGAVTLTALYDIRLVDTAITAHGHHRGRRRRPRPVGHRADLRRDHPS